MANTLVTPTWVTNETASRWMNSVKGVANFNRSYDSSYRAGGAKVGYTVLARIPITPTVRLGQTWQPQGIQEQTKPITLSYQTGVDFDWSTASQTQEIDRVRERYVNPAADALASDADYRGMLDVYRAVFNAVGTPGTTPTTRATYLDAVTKILDLAGPDDNLKAVLDVKAASYIGDTNMALFNPTGAISETYRTGRLNGKTLGISEWFQDQLVPRHTTGTFTASTPLVNGASQTGSSLITNGWASGATSLKFGDIFTVAGVYSVNRITKTSTGRLQQFSVQADISDTTGDMTISISPSIITSGPLQTVSGSPANGAAITVWSANPAAGTLSTTVSPTGLVFDPSAFAFVVADLVDPEGGAISATARSRDFGVNIRFVRQYLLQGDQNGTRLDMLHGAAPILPERACRVVG